LPLVWQPHQRLSIFMTQ